MTDEYIDLYLDYANQHDYLADLVHNRNRGISDDSMLKTLIKEALSSIQYCHSEGVIHADIKLENFLIQESQGHMVLKLADFGLSHRLDPQLDGFLMKELAGTGQYIAPECGKAKVVSSAIDIWSFGICMYEMAVGYKPHLICRRFYQIGEVPFDEKDWASIDPEL